MGETGAGESVLDAFAREALLVLDGLPGVVRIGLAVSEGGGRRLLFTSSDRLAAQLLEWCAIEASAEVPLTVAVREGRSTLGSLEELEEAFPDFVTGQREAGVSGVAAVPLVAAGRRLGGVVLYVEEAEALATLRASAETGRLQALGEGIGERLAALRVEHRRRPDPAGDGTVVFEMADSPADVAQARRFLRAYLGSLGVDAEIVDDATLCLTELATNAIVHTHGGCRVEVAWEPDLLVVRVVDEGGLGPARLRDPDEVATVGRGLQIVGALADRSGRDDERHTSWFEFDLDAAGSVTSRGA
ncbi:hypothetical protein GCM10022215_22880 [Nocardioides fonticola]|uniref:Histidine kinase/HSP90-like ATPase domain-containing protein n=1 Tax=Nocardioides fonticola TaxID=450363 RepID=A0ABP7XJ41_9ACTN